MDGAEKGRAARPAQDQDGRGASGSGAGTESCSPNERGCSPNEGGPPEGAARDEGEERKAGDGSLPPGTARRSADDMTRGSTDAVCGLSDGAELDAWVEGGGAAIASAEAPLTSAEAPLASAQASLESADAWLASFSPVVIEADQLGSADVASLQRATTQNLSRESSGILFDWLIAPISRERFYSEIWEKRPVLIRRSGARGYAEGVFGKSDVEALLRLGMLQYGTSVDVTQYEHGQRQTLNGEGPADHATVWELFSKGCTVRILHPQQWNDTLWWMLSTLERHWQQIAGCNAYLTPAGAQGFSPHYDDIDAFILQTEGQKRWRLYRPPGEQDCLARFSSQDFAEDVIGEPILDTVLMAGDLLYLPRGTVHQAVSMDSGHSLHVTISTGQRNTMADFLQMALPRALELAAEEHLQLRQSLPLDVFDFMGVVHSDDDQDPRRAAFMARLQSSLMCVLASGPWDSAVDQLAGAFIRHRLPPFQFHALGETDTAGRPAAEQGTRRRKRAKRGSSSSSSMGHQHGEASRLSAETCLKAKVEGGCRLIVEDDNAVVYHMMDNQRECHNEAAAGEADVDHENTSKGRIEFPLECAHWLEALTSLSATEPTSVAQVIERCNPGHPQADDRAAVMSIVQALLDNGVLEMC